MSFDDSSYGTCVVQRTDDGPRVLIADPVILIAADMLDEIERGACSDHVTLTDNDVLTFDCINRRVVYRINRDGYLYDLDAYPAEWPD